MRKKAIKKGELNELDGYISEKLAELSQFEASGVASVDTPASIFGDMLSHIVSVGLEGTEERIAKKVGYHLGRWIYIIDALDDFEKDTAKGRYNPFTLLYGNEIDKRQRTLISDALKNELCDIEKAYDLIDFGNDIRKENIISNVFYLGMPKTLEGIVFRDSEEENDSTRKDIFNT